MRRSLLDYLRLCLVLASVAPAIAAAQMKAVRGAEQPSACGPIFTEHFGPYDYRSHRATLKVVEDFHFTPEIEAGLRGRNGPIGGDINYTLKASPNHHRALVTLATVITRAKADILPGMEWPMECYYDRALRFAPDDTTVRMLYAQFLHRGKRAPEALAQLEAVRQQAADNPFTHYNLGLMFLEVGKPESALAQAHRAAELGFPRRDLAEALKKSGHWKDPGPVETAKAAPVAPSPASTPQGTDTKAKTP